MERSNKRENIDPGMLEILAFTKGIELAKEAVPFWTELTHSQRNPEARALLEHIRSMFIAIENDILMEHMKNSVSWVSFTEHEIKKAKAFAALLQDKEVEATSTYFKLLKRFLISIRKLGLTISDAQWENVISQVQKSTLEQANRLSTDKNSGVKIGDMRSTVSYYIEELVSVVGSPIEHDPIYSTPADVKPSVLMDSRIKSWKESKTVGLCDCRSQRALVLYSKPSHADSKASGMGEDTDFSLDQALQQMLAPNLMPALMTQTFQGLFNPLPGSAGTVGLPSIPLRVPNLHSQPPSQSTSCHYKVSIAAENVLKSIESFIEGLMTKTDSADIEILNESLSFINDLIGKGLFTMAVPFLVSLLQRAFQIHCTNHKKEAYRLLAHALKKVTSSKPYVCRPFEKWLLNIVSERISECEDKSKLPNIQSLLKDALCYVLKRKPKELASNATDAIHTKQFRNMLRRVIGFYQKQEDLVTTDSLTHGVMKFLTGLDLLNDHEKESALELFLSAVWQNTDLCDSAAKAIVSLLPHEYFHTVNTGCTLLIPPREFNVKLYQHEQDLQHKVTSRSISPRDAAFQYLDLMINPEYVNCSHQKVFCLLNAARYILYELEKTPDSEPNLQFALRNAITLLAYDASQLSLDLQPGFRVITLATSYQLMVNSWKISDPSKHSCLNGRIAGDTLRMLCYNSRFTFLLSQPISLNGDIWVASTSYIHKVTNGAHEAYVKHLLNSETRLRDNLPVKRSLLHYQCLESFIHKGEMNTALFNRERIATMTELLKETSWTVDDVSRAMSTSLFQRDTKGFIKPSNSLSGDLQIAELKGVIFDRNKDTPSITVVVKLAENGNGLLSYKDIIEILQLTSEEAETISFSLDPPSATERYHPFMKMRFHPPKLQNTDFMHSLFHADYLLKFLSTGVEVSAEPPFDLRSVDNLIKHLPNNLRAKCSPPYLRGESHMTSHRYWIEAEEVSYDEKPSMDGNKINYYIGDVKVAIKSRPLVRALNGNSFDAKHHEDSGPHAQFARDLSEHYDDISKYFPIFARVKELSKLRFVVQRLHKYMKNNSNAGFESFHKELHRIQSIYPIRHNPDSCIWVPGTYGHKVYGGVLFKSADSLGGYFGVNGASEPISTNTTHEFPKVHDLLLKPVLGPLHGGIRFAEHKERKVASSVFGPNLAQVSLGDICPSQLPDHEDVPTRSSMPNLQSKAAHLPSPSKKRKIDHQDVTQGLNADAESSEKPQQSRRSQNVQESQPQTAGISPRKLNEYHIDSVVAKVAEHQILLQSRRALQLRDTVSRAVGQSLINQAIHGEVLNNSTFQATLKSSYNFNETDFHPNAFAREQIKTAIVMRKIVEFHVKQGTEEHVIASL